MQRCCHGAARCGRGTTGLLPGGRWAPGCGLPAGRMVQVGDGWGREWIGARVHDGILRLSLACTVLLVHSLLFAFGQRCHLNSSKQTAGCWVSFLAVVVDLLAIMVGV